MAGGKGSRLSPVTSVISKQLLPVYDKPMIYYPLSTLMLAKIRDIFIVSDPLNVGHYQNLLGDGSTWGINLKYVVQKEPNGLADGLILCKKFLNDEDNVVLICGDNIFYGHNLANLLIESIKSNVGASVFAYRVNNPKDFGIINFEGGIPIRIEEKPKNPKSNLAITGLYIYDSSALKKVFTIKPSKRGELEISSLNQLYLEENKLNVIELGRGYTWLDTGNPDALLTASQFIQTIEKRQGLKICCPEEIAFYNQWINKDKISKLIHNNQGNDYSKYLKNLIGLNN